MQTLYSAWVVLGLEAVHCEAFTVSFEVGFFFFRFSFFPSFLVKPNSLNYTPDT